MSRTYNISTPENWHWKITPQQIQEIKQGNRDTLATVYFDNLPTFRRVVYNICRRHNLLCFFEDCLQQIFVDLEHYHFENTKRFYSSLLVSCLIAFGASFKSVPFKYCISLETPLRSVVKEQEFDGNTLADTLVAKECFEDTDNEENKRLVEIIEGQHLTPAQSDLLCALGIGCNYRRGLFNALRQSIQ